MIRGNPMHDTGHPPGQFRPPRYLRDIIERVEYEDKKSLQEPTPEPNEVVAWRRWKGKFNCWEYADDQEPPVGDGWEKLGVIK